MTILIVAGGFPTKKYPGNGIFEFDQAKALASQGHKVIYVAIDLRSVRRFRKWGFKNFQQDKVQVYVANIPMGAVPKKLLWFIGKKSLFSIYRRIEKRLGRPDIVHAHFLDMGIIAAEFCKKKHLPFVVTEHSSVWFDGSLSKDEILQAKHAYESADKIVCVGNALSEQIKKYTGICAKVIPNIVSMPSTEKSNRELDTNVFRFLSAGNLVESKGFDILLKAFAVLHHDFSNIRLVIMGDGPKRSELEQMTKELGVSNSVSFTGTYFRKQFAEMLAQSDVFVLATRHETFGVVFIEAMSCGVPVIATACGGPEDFVNDNVGMLVPTDNIDALVEAMKKMILECNKYDNKFIIEYVEEHFSAEQIAKRLIQLYTEVI